MLLLYFLIFQILAKLLSFDQISLSGGSYLIRFFSEYVVKEPDDPTPRYCRILAIAFLRSKNSCCVIGIISGVRSLQLALWLDGI
ncbi:MAG: hypothetical protein ACTSU6_03700 [Candidatus Njordarchaeales archaeon]